MILHNIQLGFIGSQFRMIGSIGNFNVRFKYWCEFAQSVIAVLGVIIFHGLGLAWILYGIPGPTTMPKPSTGIMTASLVAPNQAISKNPVIEATPAPEPSIEQSPDALPQPTQFVTQELSEMKETSPVVAQPSPRLMPREAELSKQVQEKNVVMETGKPTETETPAVQIKTAQTLAEKSETPSVAHSTPAVETPVQTEDTMDGVIEEMPRFDAAYLSNPAPIYPGVSKQLDEEGKVFLRVLVDIEGYAEKVELKRSSGYLRLDRAASDAVSNWRFVPAQQGNKPLSAWVIVPVSFSLKD